MGGHQISLKGMYEQLQEKKVQTYLNIEVGKVARQFHLCQVRKDDLLGDVILALVVKLTREYEETRCNVYTFVQAVVPNMLKNWKRDEIKRRETMKAMTGKILKSYEESEDFSPLGDVFEIVARRDDIQNVRRVLACLSPESRRVCELYMKTNSLNKVAKCLKQDTKTFFYVTWPRVKKEFLSFWEKVKVM